VEISCDLSKYISLPIIVEIFEFVKIGSDVGECRVCRMTGDALFLLRLVSFYASYEIVDFSIVLVSYVI
jgi:hypothetical protein